MKQQRIFRATTLALVLGMTGVMAVQPLVAHAAKAGKGGKKGRKGSKAQANVTPKLLEQVLGKPLTAEQQKGVEDAQKTYFESVARAVALSPDELEARVQDYRMAHKGGKRGGTTAPTTATAPVTTP